MRHFSTKAIATGCLIVLIQLITFGQQCALPTRWTAASMKTPMPLAEYPRPQLQRKEWLCLNGWWDYVGGKDKPGSYQPDKAIEFTGTVEKIKVPFCPESYLSGIQRPQEINMWYRKTVILPKTWNGRHILLHFEAVDHNATVFVNGQLAGKHAGGYDGFTLDITQYLQVGTNTIVVAAYDANDGKTPSGKNGPRGDYTFSSGIWQTVWMEPVNASYIESVKLTPDITNNQLRIGLDIPTGTTLMATAYVANTSVASASTSTNELILPIKNVRYWSPDDPFLYDLKLTLKDQAGKTVDEVSSYFGMREVKVGKVNGVQRPLLNGKFVLHLGLLDQGYWPDGVLTAPGDSALKYDIQYTKAAGFNVIRKHMKTEPLRFYYWADKLGLMVWQDMPAIWYQNDDTAINRNRYRTELKALIDYHYNSPSIVTWVPFNENWGAFDVKEITAWVKAYDPSRLVNGNSGYNYNPGYQKAYGDPGNGDFVDTHQYSQPYKIAAPDSLRVASLGEFGGIGLFESDHMWPVENNSYLYAPTKATLTDQYVLLLSHIDQWVRYKGLSAAVYTQTTDLEHEINGLLTYDRAIEKVELPRVKSINTMVIKNSQKLNRPSGGAMR